MPTKSRRRIRLLMDCGPKLHEVFKHLALARGRAMSALATEAVVAHFGKELVHMLQRAHVRLDDLNEEIQRFGCRGIGRPIVGAEKDANLPTVPKP